MTLIETPKRSSIAEPTPQLDEPNVVGDRAPWAPTLVDADDLTVAATEVIELPTLGGGLVNEPESTDDQVPAMTPELGAMDLVVDQIGARELWARGITGSGVNVALIDTGVADVASLSGRVVARVDFSTDQVDPVAVHEDAVGHGTHLAGIIAGRAPGADPMTGGGFLGVAPDAGIVAVKVAGEGGDVTLESVVAGIDWVVAQAAALDIRVLNLAFDTGDQSPYFSHPLAAALERAWAAGIVVVTGAGNDGATRAGLSVPATDPFVITVGAVDMTPEGPTVPEWAARGDEQCRPDLAAPGAHIESLVAPGSEADRLHPEGRVDDDIIRGSGSSQSSAIVSAAAALLLAARPELDPDQVKALLVRAAAPMSADPTVVGAGVLDVAAAVDSVVGDVRQDFRRADAAAVRPATCSTVQIPADAAWSWAGNSWIGNSWIGNSWIGNSWAGNSWIGNSWIGNSWIGNSWAGNSWIGNSWIGNSWIGNSWAGNSWIGNSWAGNSWIGNSWAGNSWIGNSWI